MNGDDVQHLPPAPSPEEMAKVQLKVGNYTEELLIRKESDQNFAIIKNPNSGIKL